MSSGVTRSAASVRLSLESRLLDLARRYDLGRWLIAGHKPAPPYSGSRVARLRARLALSQTVFAKALNVSAETVRSWEQEKRAHDGAALRLLQVAERHPEVILENVQRRSA